MLQLLVFILYTASLTGLSEQAVLTCDGGDMSILNKDDVRIVDGFQQSSSNDLIFVGNAQELSVINGQNEVYTGDVGVCYSTASLGCYKGNFSVEDCDNFIRGVIDLDGNCNNTDFTNCRVLVCGTNALLARCAFCNYTGSSLNCSEFVENDPAQDLPYMPYNSSYPTYGSCSAANINGEEIFQFQKNDNATFIHRDGKLYYGLLKENAAQFSIIGLASITTEGVISGRVATRTDSQKMVATLAHFVGRPFIMGDYAYFLFREPALEFASLSTGQTKIDTYYSRIARICKDDEGVSVSSSQILTSFLKQRLVCSQTDGDGDIIEYNEIQDFVINGTTIHAIFTSARNDEPVSALCVFDLTTIDVTFNESNFFGANGGTANDRWRANDGSSITPRPGLDCSAPNTADTNFQRDYNLMEDPAVQTNASVPIQFLEGDRFSKMSLDGSDYIIASERGCLYQVPVVSSMTDLGAPCQDPVVTSEIKSIKDLERTSINSFLVTTLNDVYVLENCTVLEDTCNLSPPVDTYTVRPNSDFEIIYDPTVCGSPIIKQNGTEITDSNDQAYLLLKKESLADTNESLIHLRILILADTFVIFPSASEPNNYTIEPYNNYTTGELKQRCDDFDAAEETHVYLNRTDTCQQATSTAEDSFDSTILLVNNQVQDCDNCAYNGCTEPCQ